MLGRQLTGEDAPLASQLGAWLEAHPGWEPLEDSEDEDDEEDSDEEGDNNSRSKGLIKSDFFLFFQKSFKLYTSGEL